jgi:glycosyltransferase involved in cell wall biosynthesis
MPDVPVGISIENKTASIIIPTFNGASRIGYCLDTLVKQTAGRNVEILVIDDGSTDNTANVVRNYPLVRLITQANAGPASARNRGALAAQGAILLFTDDDCVPMQDWLESMLEPFKDPEVVGAKGVYRTHQKSLAARFVQMEYEDKYRLMTGLASIDFIAASAFLR